MHYMQFYSYRPTIIMIVPYQAYFKCLSADLWDINYGRQKLVYRLCANFLTLPEVGIPSVRYVNAQTRRRYTDGTVYKRQPPEDGIQTLFSNAYWPLHARVIEIQTRQQLKNNSFHETQRIFMNKFCIWTPSGQRTS